MKCIMCVKKLCKQKKCPSCFVSGVLSIEAALILPMFLMLMMSILSIVGFMYINISLDCIVSEEAKRIALLRHNDEYESLDTARVNIIDGLGSGIINSGFIKGNEAGLDFSGSDITDITDREIIKLSVQYDANVPFGIIDAAGLRFESKCVMHTYTGYVNGLAGYIDDSSEYVYVTADSEVYHRSRDCSHLRLSIKSVSPSEIAVLRNASGAKYKKCKTCNAGLNCKRLYVTSSGDRYHASLSCSGLKRTVTRVRLSKVLDKRPCKRCGY